MAPSAVGATTAALSRRLWAERVAHIALILGALMLAFSVNSPWVSAIQQFHMNVFSGTDTFPITSRAPLLPLSLFATHPNRLPRLLFESVMLLSAGLPLLGVAFAVLFTQPLGRRAWRITLIGCGLWLAIITLHVLHYLMLIAQGNAFATSAEPGLTITYSDERAMWGLWLTAAALIPAWAGFIGVWLWLRNRAPARVAAIAPATFRWPLVRWLAAGAMTLGLVLWGLGFLALPWVTVNCRAIPPISLHHIVQGSCAGLDAGDALAAATPFTWPTIPSRCSTRRLPIRSTTMRC
ncbi:MAG: hypothetical protein ABI068_03155 [Ktedonobacterales bacterium]